MIGELAQVGDVVTIVIPKKNRDWGYAPCDDGTVAQVAGFGEMHYGRTRSYGLEPGVYRNASWVKVDDGDKEWLEHDGRLTLVDGAEYERREKEWRADDESWLKRKVRLRDLPETKFWEGDHVRCSTHPDATIVQRVEYRWGERDGAFTYAVSDSMTAGWNGYARDDRLELVERGDVWKYYHGEPLTFDSLDDEANFFKLLGHVEDLRNPAHDDLYAWTKEEALEAIRTGYAHGFSVGTNMFSGTLRHDVIRYRDEELGARVRQATLAGFGLVPA
jgi:hypothetical protein